MSALSQNNLEVLTFASELVSLKIDEVNAASSNCDELCQELGDLALSVPIEQISEEASRFKNDEQGVGHDVYQLSASILSYGDRLADLVPWAAEAIKGEAEAQVDSLVSTSPKVNLLSQEEKLRLGELASIEAAFLKPITSDTAVNSLLDYFAENDGEEVIKLLPEDYTPLKTKEIIRQLTRGDAKARIYEYLSAFIGYAVELTTFADAVYVNDPRPKSHKQADLTALIGPSQRSSKEIKNSLSQLGLIIQFGWLTRDDDKPSRVVRSLRASTYDPDRHAGLFANQTDLYKWERVDGSLLASARQDKE